MFQEAARTAIEHRLPRRTLEACLPPYEYYLVGITVKYVRVRSASMSDCAYLDGVLLKTRAYYHVARQTEAS